MELALGQLTPDKVWKIERTTLWRSFHARRALAKRRVRCKTLVSDPLAGAGLPFIAVGYGVYWLVRRRRKAN